MVIHDVTGIGPAAAKLLAEHNINTPAELAAVSVEHLVAIPGFSEIRATRVIAAAAELLAGPVKESPNQPAAGSESGAQDKQGKKAKGKKKDRKGKKAKGGKKGKKAKGKGKGKKKNKKKGKK